MSGMNGWGDEAERNPPIPPIRLSGMVQATMQPERVSLWLKPTAGGRPPTADGRPPIMTPEAKRSGAAESAAVVDAARSRP